LAEEALGKSLYELFPDIRGTNAERFYLETLRDRQCNTLTNEYFFRGKKCVFEFIAFPSGDGIAVLVRDVTEHKCAEQALRNAAEKWKTIFDITPGLVMLLDVDHRIIRANKTMASALGLSSHEIFNQQCFRCIYGHDEPHDPCPHTQAMADGKEHALEIYEPRLDAYFFVSATPLLDENGNPVGSVHVMRDITEPKKAEEERARLVTAIEQAAKAILTTDTEETIQYFNPSLERITGCSREEAAEPNPSILKSDRHGEALYKESGDTTADGEIWKGRLIKKDGALFKEDVINSHLRDTSNKPTDYVDVKHDVIRDVAFQEQLRHAEKLATTGKIAAVIAHEIKNPIFAISSGIQILQDHLKLNGDEQETLDIIFRQTMRVDRLIKQLLTYSTPQEMNLAPNPIKEIISEVILLNRDLLRSRKIEIRGKMPEHMPQALVDKDRIIQVLINLLQNAIDVSKEGDCIEIACRIDMKNQRVVIKVKDEGPGIPEDQRDKVFDLFFTTKKESSGMGLAISKRIVLDHGGDIRVEPRKKKGTAMVIELLLGEDSAWDDIDR
jgi:PAS domain S-box-containing protein